MGASHGRAASGAGKGSGAGRRFPHGSPGGGGAATGGDGGSGSSKRSGGEDSSDTEALDTDQEDDSEEEEEGEGQGDSDAGGAATGGARAAAAAASPASGKRKSTKPAKPLSVAGKYRKRYVRLNPAVFRGDTVYKRVAARTFDARGDEDVYTGIKRKEIERIRASNPEARRAVQVDHVVELQLFRDATVSADESYTSAVGARAATALLPHVNDPVLNFNVTDHFVNVNLKRTAFMRCLKAVAAEGSPVRRPEKTDLGLVLQARADDPRLHSDAAVRAFDIKPGRATTAVARRVALAFQKHARMLWDKGINGDEAVPEQVAQRYRVICREMGAGF